MANREIGYFPRSGENYSPLDFIRSKTSAKEKAVIHEHLTAIAKLESYSWQNNKLIRGVNQLTVGDFRIYICIDGDLLVVCYICRKVSQKAKRIDLDRAVDSMNRYFQAKKGMQK